MADGAGVTSKHSLSAQVAEAKREVALRKSAYPGFVSRGKMRQGEADEHLARMESVLATLLWLQEHSTLLREAVEKHLAEADGS